jgi:hypothetical protein
MHFLNNKKIVKKIYLGYQVFSGLVMHLGYQGPFS